MPYDDSQSRKTGCAIVAVCGLGFVALLPFVVFPFGDPGVHIAWEKSFANPVSSDCVEEALRTVASDVSRSSYVSEGGEFSRGFGRGATVTQFNYSDPTSYGHYSLDIGKSPDGLIHYWHGWSKIGTDVSDEEKAQVLPLLNRANEAVARRCGLSFFGSRPQQDDG